MKTALKRLFRRLGFATVTSNHTGVRYLDHPPATAFDSALLRTFSSLQGLTFVQVGANDGHRFDPINTYVTTYSWRGVLVEPVPSNFRALQKTYGDNTRLILRQAAVDTVEGQRNIYHLREDLPGPVPDWLWGLASFNRDHLWNAIQPLGFDAADIVCQPVPTIKWNLLWQLLPEQQCDILVIDTEGFDINLLRSAGLGTHRPKLIHFEHSHVSTAERLTFYGELIELGYDLASDRGDTTAWLLK